MRNLLLSLALLVFLYYGASWIFPEKNITPFFVSMLLLILSGQIVALKIRQVTVDAVQKNVSFVLSSFFSGEQQKSFALSAVKTSAYFNTSLNKWRSGAVTLQVQVSEKQYFRLTSRYGFTAAALLKLEEDIKLAVLAAKQPTT